MKLRVGMSTKRCIKEDVLMRKMVLYTVALALVGLLHVSWALAATINISPFSPFSVTGGNTYTADVVVSDLAGQAVSAFDIDVLFDSTLLGAPLVTFTAAQLMGGVDNVLWDAQFDTGKANASSVSLVGDADLLDLQKDLSQLTLFQISFSALKDGDAILEFGWGPGKDVKGLGNQIIVEGAAPVPEPSTFLLLGAGLAGVGFMLRKARK